MTERVGRIWTGRGENFPDVFNAARVNRRGKVSDKGCLVYLPEDVDPRVIMYLMGGLWSEQTPTDWPGFRTFIRTPATEEPKSCE